MCLYLRSGMGNESANGQYLLAWDNRACFGRVEDTTPTKSCQDLCIQVTSVVTDLEGFS